MSEEIKIEVLFEITNQDQSTSIKKHYSTFERLSSGEDTFDYNNNQVLAQRLFTGLVGKSGEEVYVGDYFENSILLSHPTEGRSGGTYWAIFIFEVVREKGRIIGRSVKYVEKQFNPVYDDKGYECDLPSLITVIGNRIENKNIATEKVET
jgi:hypothetical protein